jgi:hypothetical protein
MVGAELNVENRCCHGRFVATKTLALVRAPVGVVQNPCIQEPCLDEKYLFTGAPVDEVPGGLTVNQAYHLQLFPW